MTRIPTTQDLRTVLTALARDLTPAIQAAAVGYVTALHAVVLPYPPAGAANRPNAQGRWYERGYGPRWRRRNGRIGGRKTSQLLNRSWAITRVAGGARLQNRASYSGAVHGDDQAAFHARRGWQTIAQGRQVLEQRQTWYRLITRATRQIVRI